VPDSESTPPSETPELTASVIPCWCAGVTPEGGGGAYAERAVTEKLLAVGSYAQLTRWIPSGEGAVLWAIVTTAFALGSRLPAPPETSSWAHPSTPDWVEAPGSDEYWP
jgi:hypothetical protein